MRRLSDIFTKTHHFPKSSSGRAHMTTHDRFERQLNRSSKKGRSLYINSDKIQVYRGLDVTTNKIPLLEVRFIRFTPEFTPSNFRFSASSVISQIRSRLRIPFTVGGSNSFIYALLAKKFNPESDVFSESNCGEDSVFCKELRYSCCFLLVNVSLAVLNEYLVKRVDDMLESGMFEELAKHFENHTSNSVSKCRLKKEIGVPESGKYFKRFKSIDVDEEERKAVKAIMDNTCQLAKRPLGKIPRLRGTTGWDLKRADATETVRAAMDGGGRRLADIWEEQVEEPNMKIVKQFLME
ncbi:tRNA delta(2)-isopentenylpyrophosphate transferase [Handroanthus impetiginosus]|uniref:tRNA delta(2)-isopentenylpyrophosphate transferase n=1 Tax=Handroanthus impetiginosus TaxID=429701 RepID=A0A2G9I8K7_9LAMI|nr:tRNA delta(2)-isopentenylpyrophosphate transferase [Handroanthus impetiginosus]